MECPYCGNEMYYDDYFGRILSFQDGHIEGDIYRCDNPNCEKACEYFHIHRNNPADIHEGYPC